MSVRDLKNRYHLAQAIASNIAYLFPAKKLTVIGITGTDGKTTTASLLYSILQKAGFKAALITTLGAYIGDQFYETGFHTTTPSSLSLQKYIKKAAKSGCTHLVLEVTSHALDQNRAWGIPFRLGIVTNVSHEHLDYHKTKERYIMAKARLFKNVSYAILNMDDDSYEHLLPYIKPERLFSYSLTSKTANINGSILPQEMAIVGEFNRQNALAAAAAAQLLGVPVPSIQETISNFSAPEGRQEVVHDDKFKIMVDFAHTPNAFAKILPEVRKTTHGRLIHVFGAAGKRDVTKRPEMGKIASQYDDVMILTAEDPRGEDQKKIAQDLLLQVEGFQEMVPDNDGLETSGKMYTIINNRKKAIEFAVSIAQPEDTIILTGKGHEKSMNYEGEEVAWNDKEAVFEALNKVR